MGGGKLVGSRNSSRIAPQQHQHVTSDGAVPGRSWGEVKTANYDRSLSLYPSVCSLYVHLWQQSRGRVSLPRTHTGQCRREDASGAESSNTSVRSSTRETSVITSSSSKWQGPKGRIRFQARDTARRPPCYGTSSGAHHARVTAVGTRQRQARKGGGKDDGQNR